MPREREREMGREEKKKVNQAMNLKGSTKLTTIPCVCDSHVVPAQTPFDQLNVNPNPNPSAHTKIPPVDLSAQIQRIFGCNLTRSSHIPVHTIYHGIHCMYDNHQPYIFSQ